MRTNRCREVEVTAPLRVLVVVSNDYGELGSAMYFLRGLAAEASAVILLPQSLRHALPGRPDVHCYASLADIRSHMDAERLDAVLLFSGYLLTVGRSRSLLASLRLLRLARARGLPVLTSDPFIGLIAGPASLDFASVIERGSAWARRLAGWRLGARMTIMRWALRRAWHLYPAPLDGLPPSAHAARALAYASAPSGPVAGAPGARWIFVLSEIDYRMQLGHDAASFVPALAARLQEAIAFGKHPVVVAPRSLLDEVARHLPQEAFTPVHQADYAAFMEALLEAEYAFFWNYYSFSIIHRVLHERPVMFFAEGHMVRIVPALSDAGVRLFYAGWRPPLLRVGDPFDRSELAARAREAAIQFARIRSGIGACETPMAVLSRVVDAAPPR